MHPDSLAVVAMGVRLTHDDPGEPQYHQRVQNLLERRKLARTSAPYAHANRGSASAHAKLCVRAPRRVCCSSCCCHSEGDEGRRRVPPPATHEDGKQVARANTWSCWTWSTGRRARIAMGGSSTSRVHHHQSRRRIPDDLGASAKSQNYCRREADGRRLQPKKRITSPAGSPARGQSLRSEERRVGKECRN